MQGRCVAVAVDGQTASAHMDVAVELCRCGIDDEGIYRIGAVSRYASKLGSANQGVDGQSAVRGSAEDVPNEVDIAQGAGDDAVGDRKRVIEVHVTGGKDLTIKRHGAAVGPKGHRLALEHTRDVDGVTGGRVVGVGLGVNRAASADGVREIDAALCIDHDRGVQIEVSEGDVAAIHDAMQPAWAFGSPQFQVPAGRGDIGDRAQACLGGESDHVDVVSSIVADNEAAGDVEIAAQHQLVGRNPKPVGHAKAADAGRHVIERHGFRGDERQVDRIKGCPVASPETSLHHDRATAAGEGVEPVSTSVVVDSDGCGASCVISLQDDVPIGGQVRANVNRDRARNVGPEGDPAAICGHITGDADRSTCLDIDIPACRHRTVKADMGTGDRQAGQAGGDATRKNNIPAVGRDVDVVTTQPIGLNVVARPSDVGPRHQGNVTARQSGECAHRDGVRRAEDAVAVAC